jgi:hypothetical protein
MFDVKRDIVDLSRDTSAGVNDWLDGRASIPGKGEEIFLCSRSALGPTQPYWYRGSFPGDKASRA